MSPLAVLRRSVGPPPRTAPWARRRPGCFSTFRPRGHREVARRRARIERVALLGGHLTCTSPDADETFQSPVGLPSTPMLPLPVLAFNWPTTPVSEMSPLPVVGADVAGARQRGDDVAAAGAEAGRVAGVLQRDVARARAGVHLAGDAGHADVARAAVGLDGRSRPSPRRRPTRNWPRPRRRRHADLVGDRDGLAGRLVGDRVRP